MSRPDARTLDDWLDRLEDLPLKKVGKAEWAGPCPICGGHDRFHVRRGSRAEVLASCRHGCDFEKLAKHLWPNAAGPSRPRAPRPRPPKPPPDMLEWTAGMLRIPHDPEHACRRWAKWKTGAPTTLTRHLRFMAVSGGVDLVAPLATPKQWDADTVAPPFHAVHALHLDAQGQPRPVRSTGDKPDRTSDGPQDGRFFLARPGRKPSAELHLVEGLAHALAVAALMGEDVAAAFGPLSRLAHLAPALALRWTTFRIWADGDDAGRQGASTLAQALARAGCPVAVEDLPEGQDADDVLRDAVAEEYAYLAAERAAKDADANVGEPHENDAHWTADAASGKMEDDRPPTTSGTPAEDRRPA